MNAPAPTVYRDSGTGGHQQSTLTGIKTAILHFNTFLETMHIPPFDACTEEQLCFIQLFQKYGTYVSEHCKKLRTPKEFISGGSALQYLSGAKIQAEKKFSKNAIWNGKQAWYSALRKDIEETVRRRCIAVGIPYEEKSQPIGRELLLRIISAILKLPGDQQSEGIMYR